MKEIFKYITYSLEKQKMDACLGKNRYNSPLEAKTYFTKYSKNYGYSKNNMFNKNDKVNIYECKFCNNWHIGHSSSLYSKIDDISSIIKKTSWIDLMKTKLK